MEKLEDKKVPTYNTMIDEKLNDEIKCYDEVVSQKDFYISGSLSIVAATQRIAERRSIG